MPDKRKNQSIEGFFKKSLKRAENSIAPDPDCTDNVETSSIGGSNNELFPAIAGPSQPKDQDIGLGNLQATQPPGNVEPPHPHLPALHDFGRYIGKKLDDSDRKAGLMDRWIPQNKNDFPVSMHNKGGKYRPRAITQTVLEKYEWLAISQCPEYKGAWCTYCVLFNTTWEVGGRYEKGQKLDNLVVKPLTNFSDLTGKGENSRKFCLSPE